MKTATPYFRELAAAATDSQLQKFIGEGEDLKKWRQVQQEMWQAVRILDVISPLIAIEGRKPEPMVFGEGFKPARFEGWAEVRSNEELLAEMARRINGPLRRTTAVQLSIDGSAFEQIPRGLEGLLWLQIAEVVRGLAAGRSEVACKECGKMFVPGRKGSKKLAPKFCSERCRSAYTYQHR